jgi:hypothetical protein
MRAANPELSVEKQSDGEPRKQWRGSEKQPTDEAANKLAASRADRITVRLDEWTERLNEQANRHYEDERPDCDNPVHPPRCALIGVTWHGCGAA